MRRFAVGGLGPLITLLAQPAAAYAAEGPVTPADAFAQLAALIALLLGAMVAGYFFVRPFARVRGWTRTSRIDDNKPEEHPPQPPAAAAPSPRAPWSTEPPGGGQQGP